MPPRISVVRFSVSIGVYTIVAIVRIMLHTVEQMFEWNGKVKGLAIPQRRASPRIVHTSGGAVCSLLLTPFVATGLVDQTECVRKSKMLGKSVNILSGPRL